MGQYYWLPWKQGYVYLYIVHQGAHRSDLHYGLWKEKLKNLLYSVALDRGL